MSQMPDEKKYKKITTGVEFEIDENRNGKRVFGKIIDFGVLSSQSQKAVPHGIEELDELIDGRISINTQTGAQYILPLGRRFLFI